MKQTYRQTSDQKTIIWALLKRRELKDSEEFFSFFAIPCNLHPWTAFSAPFSFKTRAAILIYSFLVFLKQPPFVFVIRFFSQSKNSPQLISEDFEDLRSCSHRLTYLSGFRAVKFSTTCQDVWGDKNARGAFDCVTLDELLAWILLCVVERHLSNEAASFWLFSVPIALGFVETDFVIYEINQWRRKMN